MLAARFLAICLLLFAAAVPAASFRWSSQGDAVSMDPHGQTEVFSDSINALAYEYLVARGKDYSIVPQLAVSWSNPEPTRWIFHLRRGVRFHDGTPFTADDVVFSMERAMGSGYRVFASQAGAARKIDEYTVEFTTAAPNPAQLDTLAVLFIMSKPWCEKHGATRARDQRDPVEGHAVRHAMGTGPFKLVSYQPGVATRHVKNPDWWGIREGLFEGNVEAIEYRPVPNAATRIAALISGELDFVLDPPVQDIARLKENKSIRIWQGGEMRVMFFGFDQARDELLYSDVKGRNPFRDRRVRMAFYHALDSQALHTQVMRGLSVPTAIPLPDPAGAGASAQLEKRHAFDPARARQLLAEAGYPEGFGFTLHCPNDRWINDERICTAAAAMWSRVGLRVKVEAMPKAQYFPKGLKRDVSAYLLGWGGNSPDPNFILKPVMRSPDDRGTGAWNFGGRKDPQMDDLIDRIEVEADATARRELVDRLVRRMQEEVPVIPLHRQVIPWASRSNVSVVHMPNNWLVPIWVKVH